MLLALAIATAFLFANNLLLAVWLWHLDKHTRQLEIQIVDIEYSRSQERRKSFLARRPPDVPVYDYAGE